MKKAIEISEGVTLALEDTKRVFSNVLRALTCAGEFSPEAAQAILPVEKDVDRHLDIKLNRDPVRFVGEGNVTFHPAESIAEVYMITIQKYAKHNGKGEVISCLVERAKVTLRGEEAVTQRWHHKINLVVNQTPEGLRYFISANEKIFWGGWRVAHALASTGVRNRPIESWVSEMLQRYFTQRYQLQEFYPELKYYSTEDGTAASVLDTSHPFFTRYLTGKKGVKDVLNGVYSPKGEKFLVKSTFGGLGEIRSVDGLLTAMWTIRALRQFDPNFLAKLETNKSIWRGNISENSKEAVVVDGFFKMFGATEKVYNMVFPQEPTEIQDEYDVANMNDEDWDNASIPASFELLYVTDVLAMFKGIRSRLMRTAIRDHLKGHDMTMRQFHDYVDLEYKKVQQQDRAINNRTLKSFEGTVSEEIECVAPKSTHDLIRWGAEYNICIGSYADRVFNGDTYCVGFRKPDGSFWGFAEITTTKKLNQLLGKHNTPLPAEARRLIEEYLSDKHLITVKNYWGS